jgi:hypothetical protein
MGGHFDELSKIATTRGCDPSRRAHWIQLSEDFARKVRPIVHRLGDNVLQSILQVNLVQVELIVKEHKTQTMLIRKIKRFYSGRGLIAWTQV